MESGDGITLPPRNNFVDCLYERSALIMMLGFTLKCKDDKSHDQISDNVVIYLLKCYGRYFDIKTRLSGFLCSFEGFILRKNLSKQKSFWKADGDCIYNTWNSRDCIYNPWTTINPRRNTNWKHVFYFSKQKQIVSLNISGRKPPLIMF